MKKIAYLGSYAVLYKGKLVDSSVSEVIHIIDTQQATIDYAFE